MFENLAIIDVETTGTSPVRDRIIEIGILRIENGKLTHAYESLVNPQCHVPPEISMLTGIHAGQLENAPIFYALKDTVRDLLRDAMFVAHNARFDYSFIKSEFSRIEEPFVSRQLCTAKLSRTLFRRYRRHNLDSIIERFGFTCEGRHRALGDAKVLWDFLQMIQKTVPPDKIAHAIKIVTKTASLPSAITRETIDTLPESSGVYTFYNADGVPLYIGKSINLKERILSHFTDATSNMKEAKVFHSIGSLEVQKTDGELGALLRESQLIKKYKPVYNRQLREMQRFVIASKKETPEGYLTISLEEVSVIRPADVANIVAVFRSLGQAKRYLAQLATDHKLCKKLLSLEKAKTACFGYQLDVCAGACIGKELPARYNIRFIEAFGKTKIKQWPFNGAIAIYEGKTAHVVFHWCYLGTINNDSDAISNKYEFDYDTYRILSRYLLQNGTKLKIRPYVLH